MIYDVIIVWAWAAWLFAWINLEKKYKKLILEKTAKPWMKVLLSWWERANVSNMDIEPTRDYFTQNKNFLHSIFSRYTNWDIMSYFATNGINIVEEDRSRLILESWDSKELLNCLLDNIKSNNCELKVNQDVKDITLNKDWNYTVVIEWWNKYISKNVIVSSWWKSFAHIGTTGEWYSIAKKLWLKIVTPYRTLCWMATKKDLSEVSGVSCNVDMRVVDKNNKKPIYSEIWPILFTHFGISWPIVHNLSNSIWEYLNNLWLEEKDFEKYILDNLSLDLYFDIDNTPKRLIKFFELSQENNYINIELQNWRSWKEAKATWWWIDTDELDNHMQSKKYPWLYFIWEVVDITGKTGWFNLQWAWSSAYVSALEINKNLK